mmetsp:Transcript_12160/g.28869  ORF Transcript_12160/g.28869 Transcript_12160/m.28869 type:complete len:476 (+) Transcript_12160:97-1524(+)|eukprot:CAMPEP_0197186072 /NCGR_PEP_ID=MMETSP1423-20130617/13166_1 /TAXON_ID=476441 /ORGANISM="Pseudo-nitzschia heimii, Strain UNC1101" /LENGTH=475 /DNA_ID=CAMNT_0042637285 /DNA_START=13 /DNA_END=1440 /DNA_ORIENTATION=+
MKHTPNRFDDAISSGDSLGTLSDDSNHDFSMNEDHRGRRYRQGNRNQTRKKGGNVLERRGTDVKRMMTPVVKVLLFGVLMSFLDVLYIIKNLEGSPGNSAPGEEFPSKFSDANADKKKTEEQSLSEGSMIERNSSKIERNSEQDKKRDAIDDILADREPILRIIADAGIAYKPKRDIELLKKLPKWSDVVEMYGPEPVIYGMNEGNCERFQAQTDKGDHLIGTAGMFNSGTNLMSELLLANCVIPDRIKKHGQKSRGIRWQVPWGKHSPVGDKEFRETHKTEKDKDIDAREIMPMVTIRDPLVWLKSMCRHKYTARWEGFQEKDHCPNFLRSDLNMFVKYNGFNRGYESLMHLWNDWYNEYKNIDVPFLLVRFEDLVFHPAETVTKVCECGGGRRVSKDFRYIVTSAKKGKDAHGAVPLRTGFVDAIVKYGDLKSRYKGFATDDLQYVSSHVDNGLMEMMQYSAVDPLWNERNTE